MSGGQVIDRHTVTHRSLYTHEDTIPPEDLICCGVGNETLMFVGVPTGHQTQCAKLYTTPKTTKPQPPRS